MMTITAILMVSLMTSSILAQMTTTINEAHATKNDLSTMLHNISTNLQVMIESTSDFYITTAK